MSDDESMPDFNYDSSSTNATDEDQHYYLSPTEDDTDDESTISIPVADPSSDICQNNANPTEPTTPHIAKCAEHEKFIATLKKTAAKAAANPNLPQPKKRGRPRLNKDTTNSAETATKSGIMRSLHYKKYV